MFGKLAADALGLSDIGKIIAPADYDKTESDDYIFHEEGEKIFFLIKSKSDEYCFTNNAFIHLDGDSAMSKKRRLKRYTYLNHMLTNVWLETAGTIDLDVEIKFNIGEMSFSIDVDKKQVEQLKDLYKSLTKISTIQHENDLYHAYSNQALNTVVESMKGSRGDGLNLAEFSQINEYVFNWKMKKHEEFRIKDFTEVFDLYINN